MRPTPKNAAACSARLTASATSSALRSGSFQRDGSPVGPLSIDPRAYTGATKPLRQGTVSADLRRLAGSGYGSLLLRVAIHGTMMPRTMAKRNEVSQSIVLALCKTRFKSRDTSTETSRDTKNTVTTSTSNLLNLIPGLRSVRDHFSF